MTPGAKVDGRIGPARASGVSIRLIPSLAWSFLPVGNRGRQLLRSGSQRIGSVLKQRDCSGRTDGQAALVLPDGSP